MTDSAEISVPVFKQLPPLEDLSDVEERSDSNDADLEIHKNSVHTGFEQYELNDLVHDVGPKESAEILASRLNEKNFEQGVKVSYYIYIITRESTFLQYFQTDSGFVFCHNILSKRGSYSAKT